MRSARAHMRQLVVAFLWGAALLGVGVAGAAERTFYKSTLPNGRAIYSDEPVAGAQHSEKISVEVGPPVSTAAAASASRALELNDQQLSREADARLARQAQVQKQVAEAYERLVAARARFEEGRAVAEGDRQGRRVTPRYWERQQSLATAAAQANAELEAALAARQALR